MLGHIVRRKPSPATVISLTALFVALGGTTYAATGGTFILGRANTAGTASSLKSGVTTGNTLAVTNTGGTPAAKFTSNAGVASFAVSNATKVANLNADMLDGVSASAFAQGQNVTILANRFVGNGIDSTPGVTLLELPDLGTLSASCYTGGNWAYIYWTNTTAYPIDAWTDTPGYKQASIAQPGALHEAAFWAVDQNRQAGSTLILGHGNSPGARQTASITLSAYRSAVGAPCALQATATLWSTP